MPSNPLVNPEAIRFAQVQQKRRDAIDIGTDHVWRIYTRWRAAYRDWTLQRLAQIEADESEPQ